jgi:cold shock CspA family protein
MSIICQYHKDKGLHPKMINFGKSPLGTTQYVCARCARIRSFGEGQIVTLKNEYGFIRSGTKDYFFHYKNLANNLKPFSGMRVQFEVLFLDNDLEAINIKPINK